MYSETEKLGIDTAL